MNLPTIREKIIIRKMQQKQENYMRNTIITRKRHKFYNNTQNTNFITMQKIQILSQCTKHKFYHNAKIQNI